MIFLKCIEAKGFKSYAEFTSIVLDEPFIGIVGPNGSGKTNVVDAIRWVLGETSSKQLRSDTNNEIIFYGSDIFNPSDEASVTLYFDNSKRILNTDEKEITVKRVLKRNSDSSDYYLNDKIAKRKDIIDLFLDTGLSKGSLGIISQGTVQSFVDAKPEERRKIFEEAAGVSKYTKIKNERLNQLAIVQKNLENLNNTKKQYQSEIKKLEIQAAAAQKFLEVKNNLKTYELFSAKKQYLFYSKKNDESKQKLQDISKELQDENDYLNRNKTSYLSLKDEKNEEEEKLQKLNKERFNLQEKINELNIQKANYESNLKLKLSSKDKQEKANALAQTLLNLQNESKIWNSNIKKADEEISNITNKKKEILSNLQKVDSLLNEKNANLNTLVSQQQFIEQKIQNEFQNENGVKTLLQNKEVVPGLINTLGKLIIKVEEKYQLAIELALSKNINTLVVNSVDDAKIGIDFLKKNQAGVASFMPLNAIKPSFVAQNLLLISQNFSGFINTADKLVNIDEKYYIVLQSLIGNVLIVDNLQNANLLAKAINYSLKIISLDGDIIHRGGMIVGGSINKKNSNFNLKEKNEQIINGINFLKEKIQIILVQKQKLQVELEKLNEQNNLQTINLATSNQKIQNINQNIQQIKNELASLDITNTKVENNKANEVIEELSKLEATKINLSTQLELQEKKVSDINNKFESLSENNNQQNQKILILTQNKNDLEKQLYLVNDYIESAKKTANSYNLTIENVINSISDIEISNDELQQKILNYKTQIQSFGPINMQAVEELKNTQEKFDELNKNIEDIIQAENDLNNVILSLDKEVIKIFKNKIYEINQTLPLIFSKLFKNGTCEVQFTDPDDLLNTGIDVVIKPSKKQIKKLSVLSGGEKSIISLSVLLTILRTSNFPLVVLDEAESALDPKNTELLAKLIKESSSLSQFLVITHRKETMVECNKLIGASMQKHGVTSMFNVNLKNIKITGE